MELLSLLILSLSTFATEPLQHFQPGNYKLKQGVASECGQGDFKITNQGASIMLGASHVLTLQPGSGSRPSDLPGEDDCTYDYKNENKIVNDSTQITMTEVKKCKGQIQYTLILVADLRDAKVNLSVRQTGDDGYDYTCVWERKR